METSGAEGPSVRSRASAYERRLRELAYLAPDIQRAILEGRQPTSLFLEDLIHGEIPILWADQRKVFGF